MWRTQDYRVAEILLPKATLCTIFVEKPSSVQGNFCSVFFCHCAKEKLNHKELYLKAKEA